MASFGHVAVGLLTGRLHGGAGARPDRRTRWQTLALFAVLATLPDADVLLVALGASETGPFGHRGALHSLTMAVVIGILCAIWARRVAWPVWRTALAGAAAVASHAVLDLLGVGGNSLALFWPLSNARFHSPWQLLPDAPRGLKLLTPLGLLELATEFVLFLPVTLYALWPHITARRGRVAMPSLQMIDGASATPTPSGDSPNSAERDPALRSSG
ncbi:MAG TPA: metal-dependent hydrolase [Polyangia bacterium]|jgi:inner membrane protein|nr:metal-dependent hydrolase [Polyangia bacterium]